MAEFTEWFPWDRRDEIPCVDQRGVYAIAHFTNVPEGPADPTVAEVAYVGETKGRTSSLKKRLNTFDKAARVGGGKHKHSGGNRYQAYFGGDLTGVYVALHAPDGDERMVASQVKLVERQVIRAYDDRWHRLPVCNAE